jgi:hypothetical protein
MSFVDVDLPDNAVFSNNKRMRNLEDKIAMLENEIQSLKQQFKGD